MFDFTSALTSVTCNESTAIRTYNGKGGIVCISNRLFEEWGVWDIEDTGLDVVLFILVVVVVDIFDVMVESNDSITKLVSSEFKLPYINI